VQRLHTCHTIHLYNLCAIFLVFSGPGVILFSPEPANIESDSTTGNDHASNGDYSTASVHRMLLAAIVLTAILSSALTIVALNYLSHRKYPHYDKSPHYEYTPL